MEQYNDNNDFEQFLKDKIDDFRMIPQRKVWYSIYNHLHPDRKWPSIAVCLLILVAILHIGISNNTAISKNAIASKELAAKNIELENEHTIISANQSPIIASNAVDITKAKNSTAALLQKNNLPTSNLTATQITSSSVSDYTLQKKSNSDLYKENSSKEYNDDVAIMENQLKNNDYATSNKSDKLNVETVNEISIKNNFYNSAISEGQIDIIRNNIFINKKVYHSDKLLQGKKTLIASVKENKIALQNLASNAAQIKIPLPKNKNSITYYLTPSIGYRNLTSIRSNKSSIGSSSISPSNNNEQYALQDDKALNLEIGASLEHAVTKKIRTKVGIQFNYTNYIAKASELDHPIQNALAVGTQQNTFSSMSYYAKPGNISLNKSTLQVAVPIGVDYKILGNDKIKWYVGATIQPTYVIAGSAYLLSADATNYSNEKSYLRKLNINTAIETFISIKTAKGIVLNVGPQFRYQLLSSYKNTYNYKENLYNLGIKVGVSTSF